MFDIVKEKLEEDSTKQILEEQLTVLFPLCSFKVLVYARD